jgi:hypothetical protein
VEFLGVEVFVFLVVGVVEAQLALCRIDALNLKH